MKEKREKIIFFNIFHAKKCLLFKFYYYFCTENLFMFNFKTNLRQKKSLPKEVRY